jgi:hypothetical protein
LRLAAVVCLDPSGPMPSKISIALLIALAIGAVPALGQTFVFHLRGDQEVPPVPSVATGGCMATLNQPAQQATITCVHNVAGATVMHIHRGAPGVNGPIVFDLGNPASPVNVTWSGMTPADISDMLAGNFYINIHTAGRPAGEIRGQFLTRTVDLVAFTANGAQVVPPNPSSATANCTADLDNPATSLVVNCTHNFASPQSAHIHEAPTGQIGPSVFTFGSPNSPLSANVPVTPQLVADFAAVFLYLDIHGPAGSEAVPGEEIRGQIGTPPAPPTTGTIEIVKATQPAGGTGFNFTDNVPGSPGTFSLNDGQTRTFSAVPAGTYTISENDPTATPGGYTLSDLSCSDADSTGDLATRSATVRLAAGETVRCTFRNLRTSPTDTLFVFHLSGDQEAPPVATAERGGCMGRFDAGASQLTLICTHDVASATVMHIHRGAPGVNGPIVFDLGSPDSPVSATWSGMTPANVGDLMAGNFYINIHTAGRPAGAIRGQILPRTVDFVSFTMSAAQVVPPGTGTATGNCTADLDNPATALAIQCTHNLPSPDQAHVHQAPAGVNGPIVFTFPSPASPFSANVPMTPRLVADFAAYFLYVDVHGVGGSESSPADEIRGQIGTQAPPPATGTIRIVKSTAPAGGSGFGFTDDVPGSSGSFTLNDGGVRTFTSVAAGTYTITENDPAAGGYSLTDVACDDADSSGNAFARTASVHLQAGETVTCTFHNLQTQAASALFVFHLSGDQEVPPVATPATGGCFMQFNAGASRLSIVCTHNVSSPVLMHIHRGAPGVNGPILFDLGDPVSPVEAVWTGMTPGDVADLMAGNLYVNIHASGRPAGEIRGQILPRTVDHFSFVMTGGQVAPPSGSTLVGNCSADLSDDAGSLAIQCRNSIPNPTAIHLHDAPPGVDGPVVFDFPPAGSFSGSAPLTPRLVADFAAGFLYLEVHSADFPDGEIRGQLTATSPITAAIPMFDGWMMMALIAALASLAVWRMR